MWVHVCVCRNRCEFVHRCVAGECCPWSLALVRVSGRPGAAGGPGAGEGPHISPAACELRPWTWEEGVLPPAGRSMGPLRVVTHVLALSPGLGGSTKCVPVSAGLAGSPVRRG